MTTINHIQKSGHNAISNDSDRAHLCLVELDQGVMAETTIPTANHAALRAGFAGYTSNPRWTSAKVMAWKTGRKWRQALAQGNLVIRPQDSMLVPVQDADVEPSQETIEPPARAESQGIARFCRLPSLPQLASS